MRKRLPQTIAVNLTESDLLTIYAALQRCDGLTEELFRDYEDMFGVIKEAIEAVRAKVAGEVEFQDL